MRTLRNILFVALIGGSLFSCTKNETNGPEIKTATSSFEVTEAFASSATNLHVDLAAIPKFSAKFSEEVSWTITLKGARSGAVWEKKGLSDEIVQDNNVWFGQSTSINNFLFEEMVGVQLDILGIDSSYTIDSLQVVSMEEFSDSPIEMRNGVKHILVDDFDAAYYQEVNSMAEGLAPDQNDINVSFGVSENIVLSGSQSYYMRGQDINDNSWSGGINSANLLEFYRGQDSTALPVDSGIKPENLYFNIFIYGTGKPNTSVQMKVYELDDKPGSASADVKTVMDVYNFAKESSSNAYNQAQNDGYIFDIEVTWTGWKLVSVPYSDFRVSNDPNTGGNGDRTKESFRIVGFGISLLSFPTSGQLTEAYIDRVTMTVGGRYQKRK